MKELSIRIIGLRMLFFLSYTLQMDSLFHIILFTTLGWFLLPLFFTAIYNILESASFFILPSLISDEKANNIIDLLDNIRISQNIPHDIFSYEKYKEYRNGDSIITAINWQFVLFMSFMPFILKIIIIFILFTSIFYDYLLEVKYKNHFYNHE